MFLWDVSSTFWTFYWWGVQLADGSRRFCRPLRATKQKNSQNSPTNKRVLPLITDPREGGIGDVTSSTQQQQRRPLAVCFSPLASPSLIGRPADGRKSAAKKTPWSHSHSRLDLWLDDTDSSSDLPLPVHSASPQSASALPSTTACTKQTAAADALFDLFFIAIPIVASRGRPRCCGSKQGKGRKSLWQCRLGSVLGRRLCSSRASVGEWFLSGGAQSRWAVCDPLALHPTHLTGLISRAPECELKGGVFYPCVCFDPSDRAAMNSK